jgi:hypothetical protein
MASSSSFVSEGSVTAAAGPVGEDVHCDERDGGHQDIQVDVENTDIWSFIQMS